MIDRWVVKAWVTDGCPVPVSVIQLSKQDGGVGHSDETLKKKRHIQVHVFIYLHIVENLRLAGMGLTVLSSANSHSSRLPGVSEVLRLGHLKQ